MDNEKISEELNENQQETVQDIHEPVPSPVNEITEKKANKPKLFGIYVMLSILLLAVTASIILSAFTLNAFMTKSAEVAAVSPAASTDVDDSSTTKENDVTIGEQYVIRSTEHISDAYKSGDTSSLDDKDKETLDMAEKVLKEIIKDDMSDYEKEKAVYEWLAKNVNYDQGALPVIPTSMADSDNPYGVLKNKTAVCVGYATTFRLFMQMMDIPCMVVHDTYESHSWDLIQLDGDWYHTDVYSDQGNGGYANFNMNDELCGTSHDWDRTFFPAATSLKYNVLYNEAKDASDIYSIPGIVKEALDSDATSVSFKLPKTLSESEMVIAYQMVEYLSNSLSMTQKYSNYALSGNYAALDDSYFIIITISKMNDNYLDPNKFTDEQKQKLGDAINNAFGSEGISFDFNSFLDPYGYNSYNDYTDYGMMG